MAEIVADVVHPRTRHDGWDVLLNRTGTTWRKLDTDTREAVVDAATARRFIQQQPSVIERPVVEWESGLTVGFDPSRWERMHAR